MPEAATRPQLTAAVASAWRGVSATWRQEANFRTEVVVGALALAVSAWLGAGTVVVLAFCALVLALELVNTAIERLADALHPEPHALVGAAKDASAGAVVVGSIAAVVAGLLVLGPPLLDRLSGVP